MNRMNEQSLFSKGDEFGILLLIIQLSLNFQTFSVVHGVIIT